MNDYRATSTSVASNGTKPKQPRPSQPKVPWSGHTTPVNVNMNVKVDVKVPWSGHTTPRPAAAARRRRVVTAMSCLVRGRVDWRRRVVVDVLVVGGAGEVGVHAA